jgi:hypothetical protein
MALDHSDSDHNDRIGRLDHRGFGGSGFQLRSLRVPQVLREPEPSPSKGPPGDHRVARNHENHEGWWLANEISAVPTRATQFESRVH